MAQNIYLNRIRILLLAVSLGFSTFGLGGAIVHAQQPNKSLQVQTTTSASQDFNLLNYKIDEEKSHDLVERVTRLEEETKYNSSMLTALLGCSSATVLEMLYRILSSRAKKEM